MLPSSVLLCIPCHHHLPSLLTIPCAQTLLCRDFSSYCKLLTAAVLAHAQSPGLLMLPIMICAPPDMHGRGMNTYSAFVPDVPGSHNIICLKKASEQELMRFRVAVQRAIAGTVEGVLRQQGGYLVAHAQLGKLDPHFLDLQWMTCSSLRLIKTAITPRLCTLVQTPSQGPLFQTPSSTWPSGLQHSLQPAGDSQ